MHYIFLIILLSSCSLVTAPLKTRIKNLNHCELENFINSYLPGENSYYIDHNCPEEKRTQHHGHYNGQKPLEAIPVPANRYIFSSLDNATDRGKSIDIDKENHLASTLLQTLSLPSSIDSPLILIVPGYATTFMNKNKPIHENAIERLKIAVKVLKRYKIPVILLSGGNVHPDGTQYNEAMEMKKYLIEKMGLPSFRIAIEPFARHSTPNIRNSARFMIAHNLKTALIATSHGQSAYFSFDNVSSLKQRAYFSLGYHLGEFKMLEKNITKYTISKAVLRRGNDQRDP